MKKTNPLFDLQLEWLRTLYDSTTKNASDRFMINAFFYLSNLESDISQNIDDVNMLFEAIKKYDDFCIKTILQTELKNADIRIVDNLWELFNDALAKFYGDNSAKKKEVLNSLAILILDAQMQYVDKYKTNCTTFNKQLDDYVNELFGEYEYDYKYKQAHYRTKPLDGYEPLLSEIINSYKMNDNDLTIVTSEQSHIINPFNMWSVLEARQTIALFTLIHLFKITGGQIEKIKKLVTNFKNEHNSPYRFQQEIFIEIQALLEKVSELITDKNKVTCSNNDYEAKCKELDYEKNIIETRFNVDIIQARWDKESEEKKDKIISDKKKALMRLKLSANEIKILEHQSTHNQEVLNLTYRHVLKELKYEYYGVFEPLIDKSKLVSVSPYLEKIQSYHDAYVSITDSIFSDSKQSRMKHNFSFLYKCAYEYPYGGKEEYIFSEYASALSSGWMLQAIIGNFDLIKSDDIKSSLLNNDLFAMLHKYKNYAVCYPLVYLYNLKLIGMTEAFKIAEKLLGQLTKRKNFKDDSFEKNFKILCDALNDSSIHDFCSENARYLFTKNL